MLTLLANKGRLGSGLNFTPGPRLIGTLVVLAVVSIVLSLAEAGFPDYTMIARLQQVFYGVLLAAGIFAMFDWLISRRVPVPILERQVSATVAVNRPFKVTLRLQHFFAGPVTIKICERFPVFVDCPAMPLLMQLQPKVASTLHYQAKAIERGELKFTECLLRVPSRWKLWQFDVRIFLTDTTRVYPDFSAVAAYSLLAVDNHVSQIGIKRKPRRGEGTEFHQLRDYRQGDSLRQVDWKATSRKRKVISKDYSDERDQQVVLMIDSGRRMRAKDDVLSHFDHSLNALLLVSYIALRQGDNVSVMSFGGDNRWIPRKKGAGQEQAILTGIYDLKTATTAPDYLSAAERLVHLQSKRSLVIIITNCRDEDTDELMLGLQLLRKRHVVLLANLRETALDDSLSQPIDSFDQALEYAGVVHYLSGRDAVLQQLKAQGVLTLDCAPQNLAAQVANSYLEIKRAGLL